MKKKIIAILVSAAILLSGLFSAIYALNGQGSNIASTETEIIYDPVTELRKTTKTEDGLDFSDAAFKAQIKYYMSVFADAKNYSISSGVNTIGGTSVGGPANWHRYCAYTFSDVDDVLNVKMVTSNGENRLVFKAQATGEYTILPYQIGESGGSLKLSVGGGFEQFEGNSVSFKIFETRSNKTIFSATLNENTPTANIAKADGSNITLFLCEGDEIYFTASTTDLWHDVSGNAITLQSNFKISYDTTQNYSESDVFVPSEHLKASVVEDVDTPDFSAGIFRPDSSYLRGKYSPMNKTLKTDADISIGNIGDSTYDYWYRYCAFNIQKNRTAIRSKMVTGRYDTANRIVFTAPYSAYYNIVPRGLNNMEESSIELKLGSYASEFGTNTASFQVVNPQTEEYYTSVTLYADDGNGNANLTGNIEETKGIYLEKGQKLYFVTSTTADWFVCNYTQTVFLDFDFEIFMSEKDDIQEYYKVKLEPMGLSKLSDSVLFQTRYPFGEFQTANETREMNGYVVIGNNQNVNWDKYAAFEIAKGEMIARLANKNCGAKMIFTAPEKSKYKILGESSFSLCLGNYFDKFSPSDSVILKISKTVSGETSVIAECVLTKENSTANLPETFIELNQGDMLTFDFATTAEWFEEAEYQTISAKLCINIEADIPKLSYATTVYNPVSEILSAAENIPSVSSATLGEAHKTDFSDCLFKTFNQYYSFSNEEQYASFINGVLYTYGYTYQDGTDGRSNQLLRGSFKIDENLDNKVTAIIGKAGDDCVQTLTFTANEAGWYAINPVAFSESESGWIKNVNTNLNLAKAKLEIYDSEGLIYASRPLSLEETEVLTHSKVLYLEAGESIRFKFEGLDTTWNTDLRLALSFNVSKVNFN